MSIDHGIRPEDTYGGVAKIRQLASQTPEQRCGPCAHECSLSGRPLLSPGGPLAGGGALETCSPPCPRSSPCHDQDPHSDEI